MAIPESEFLRKGILFYDREEFGPVDQVVLVIVHYHEVFCGFCGVWDVGGKVGYFTEISSDVEERGGWLLARAQEVTRR